MSPISELSLEPLEEHGKSFVKGYVGLTPSITLTGKIKFKCARDSHCVLGLYLTFKGQIRTHLSVSGSTYKQSETIYLEKTLVLGDGHSPIKTDKGLHSFPFELVIQSPKQLSNYSSPLSSKSTTLDGGSISYELIADMEILSSGFFGSKRQRQTVSEPIDIPCVDLNQVLSLVRPQPLDSEGYIGEEEVQVRADLDRHSLFPGQSVHLIVDTNGTPVLDMTTELLQSETIVAQGQTRHQDYLLANGTHFSENKVQDGILRSTLTLPSSHIKHGNKPYRSVDVHSPFSHALISIAHNIRITITYKAEQGGKASGFIDVPLLVSDLDSETVSWIQSRYLQPFLTASSERESMHRTSSQEDNDSSF
jgi:hypothetical protein